MTTALDSPDIAAGPDVRGDAAAPHQQLAAPASSYVVKRGPVFELSHRRAEGGAWVVEDMVTGIFGAGPSVEEAIHDVRAALREHRDVLAAQAALSPDLQTQLEYLDARLPQQS